MTANELADELEKMIPALPLSVLIKSVTMLRQQQVEIEKLGSELDRIVGLYTDKAIKNEALHRFIDERGETGQLIIWKAQEK